MLHDMNGDEDLRIAAVVGADPEAAKAFVELMTYVGFIDRGFCQTDGFFDELRVRIAPGDYSLIVEVFDGNPPVGTVQAWWTNAQKGGGCPRGRTRVMATSPRAWPPTPTTCWSRRTRSSPRTGPSPSRAPRPRRVTPTRARGPARRARARRRLEDAAPRA
jgi:hypothetical protein